MDSLKGQIATNWRFGTKQSSPKARKVGLEAGPDVEGSTANADNPEHSTANLDREGFFEVKRSLHRTVLSRMDLAAAETMAPDRLRQNLAELIDLIIVEKSLPVNEAERLRLVRDLQNEIMGLGPIDPLLADPNISEIMVNGPQRVFVEQEGRVRLTDIRFNGAKGVVLRLRRGGLRQRIEEGGFAYVWQSNNSTLKAHLRRPLSVLNYFCLFGGAGAEWPAPLYS